MKWSHVKTPPYGTLFTVGAFISALFVIMPYITDELVPHKIKNFWWYFAAFIAAQVTIEVYVVSALIQRQKSREGQNNQATVATPSASPSPVAPSPTATEAKPSTPELRSVENEQKRQVEPTADPKQGKPAPSRRIKPEDTQRISAAVDATGQRRGTIYLSTYDPTDSEAKEFTASMKQSLIDAGFTVTDWEYKRKEKEGECPSLEVLLNPAGQVYHARWRVILVSAWEKMGLKPQEKYSNNAPHSDSIMVNIGRNR